VALLSALPYALAARLAPANTIFNGFLINPIDGFTYLAKMQQGAEGYWTLVLPYAPEPGPRAFLYVFYLLLGQISRLVSPDLILTFHVSRIAAATLMFYCAYRLCERICTHRHVRWFAFGLMLFGSGLGWLGLFCSNLESSDILIPESIPYLLAYSNPHFPLTAAALLVGILAALSEDWNIRARVMLAAISGAVLGAVLPFSYVSLVVILGLWIALELWFALKAIPRKGGMRINLNRGITLGASFVGALPWLVYDLWLSHTHPVISAWNVQNLTPSPNPIAYLFGFAPLLILAAFGVIRGKPWRTSTGRLLLVWLLSGFLLLYAPLGFQRRLSLGLAFPIAILAAWGWGSLSIQVERRRPIAIALIAMFSLTNLLVVTAGLTGVAAGDPSVVFTRQERASYRWIGQNIPENSLILAGKTAGNRLPAFASVRVLYGHPFETPGAEAQAALVESLFQDDAQDLNQLRQLGVSWIYYGPDERGLGEPAWLAELALRWQDRDVAIYQVPPA
jgi:hypothetical protein